MPNHSKPYALGHVLLLPFNTLSILIKVYDIRTIHIGVDYNRETSKK